MSTIASTDDAFDCRPRAEAGAGRLRALDTVRRIVEAAREGNAAERRYRQLTGRGVAGDAAARQVFAEIYAGD